MRPAQKGRAPLGRQHHAARELVRRRGEDRAGAGMGVEVGHAESLVVDTDRDRLEPGLPHRVRQPGPARVLDRHGPVPGGGQRLAEASYRRAWCPS